GIAVNSAANAGDLIEVAIRGTVFVKVQGTISIGDQIHADATEGNASLITTPSPGELLGKILTSVNINNQALVLVTLK
ncbi:MAG: capsid cement protein, partial [Candidatus Saccharibacteria bacterium]